MMTIFIRNLRIIRTLRLILKSKHVSETQSEISADDMGFLNLLKKFLDFF